MALLDRLIREARKSMRARGHEPKSTQRYTTPGIASIYCSKCDMSVGIIAKPLPNEIQIGGEAVALNCNVATCSKEQFAQALESVPSDAEFAAMYGVVGCCDMPNKPKRCKQVPHIPDPRTHTKNNQPRKGKRKSISERRFLLRQALWIPLRDALRHECKSHRGFAKRIANAIGVPPSQIHRYICEGCEHDQEPNFTIGESIKLYLATLQQTRNQFQPK